MLRSTPTQTSLMMRARQAAVSLPQTMGLSRRYVSADAVQTSHSLAADDAVPTVSSGTLTLLPRAVEKLRALAQAPATAHQMLRIAVESGGCHGYQYRMQLTDEMDDEEDLILEQGDTGARVLVDRTTMEFLRGSELDYTHELIGSSFQVVNNPRAESSCGCKVSFNMKSMP